MVVGTPGPCKARLTAVEHMNHNEKVDHPKLLDYGRRRFGCLQHVCIRDSRSLLTITRPPVHRDITSCLFNIRENILTTSLQHPGNNAPTGRFRMGSPPGHRCWHRRRSPSHSVKGAKANSPSAKQVNINGEFPFWFPLNKSSSCKCGTNSWSPHGNQNDLVRNCRE